MNYQQTLTYIYNLKGCEHKGDFNLRLDNIKILLKKIGNPEKFLKVIHVGGTNGKGSVCVMVSSILKESGYKIGMYTSPHLIDFRERFQINGKKISKKDIVFYFNKIKNYVTNQTFFEVITAIAFLYFKDKNIDFLICEVGLGGRLDATNVIMPLISVITNVGLEHQKYLGKTIKEIAYEKAGIIKPKRPIVTGAEGTALNVIMTIAKEKKSKLYTANRVDNPIKIDNSSLELKGTFQLKNAYIALKTVEVLNKNYNLKINKDKIKHGLLKAKLSGRFEFLSKNILVDCAHNLDAAKALRNELLWLKKEKRYKKLYLIIGILKDKDYQGILNQLIPLADKLIFVKAKIFRALEPIALIQYTKKNKDGKNKDIILIEDVNNALKYSKQLMGKNDLIVVTGSIYVVGEMISALS